MSITRWAFMPRDGRLGVLRPSKREEWPGTVTGHGAGYGVLKGAIDCRNATLAAGFSYLYADGPYWLAAKFTHLRLVCNDFWHVGGPDREADLAAAGCVLKPWAQGDAVIVAPHSANYHRLAYGEDVNEWVSGTVAELKKHTDRPIVVREKAHGRDIPRRVKSMLGAFKTAWAVVTSGSTIGVEAVCRGVPVFNTRRCASSPVALSDLSRIESPLLPDMDERRQWAMNLAARQFNSTDLNSGKALRIIEEDSNAYCLNL